MAKSSSFYYCTQCGNQSSTWIGKCPACGAWNSYEQEVVHRDQPKKGKLSTLISRSVPKKIGSISIQEFNRVTTGSVEFDRVLGGGIVPGSLVLLGGEPGIGKSTLLLQVALSLPNFPVVYVSGEESESQLKMRAERINDQGNSECYILTETDTGEIFKHLETINPQLVIIDSIQTMQSGLIDSAAGSISQIKECATEFQHYSKTTGIPTFLIGHITKDGNIAGPKILEHIVDTVLQFEGDQHYGYRIIRALKNRYGATSELGIFEMHSGGLREIADPSNILISNKDELFSGNAIAAIMEGNRPMMIETQALVSSAVYGTPQRSTAGFDLRRMNMLLAVLEKRCNFKLGAKDVFLNIAGGFHIEDPGINLAVVSAILSSAVDIEIDAKTCFCGELGLSGEIRPVSRIEQRISEAEKLGFNRIFLSKYNMKGINQNQYKIKLCPVVKIEEVMRRLFN